MKAEKSLTGNTENECGVLWSDSLDYLKNPTLRAMKEHAIEFAKWYHNLTPVQRCTVHSLGGTGLFQQSIEELYKKFNSTL